jgi:hypothetical protein
VHGVASAAGSRGGFPIFKQSWLALTGLINPADDIRIAAVLPLPQLANVPEGLPAAMPVPGPTTHTPKYGNRSTPLATSDIATPWSTAMAPS